MITLVKIVFSNHLATSQSSKRFLLILSIVIIYSTHIYCQQWWIPVNLKNRHSTENIKLTQIGQFGLRRKERPKVPSHLHTGIDIKRPGNNYLHEPIFSVSEGVVISVRSDGPFAQIIIEHQISKKQKIWTVYEHISDIKVRVSDKVTPHQPIAHFMSKEELFRYGFKFDHLHFEVMKKQPLCLKPDSSHPQRFYATFGLLCYTENELMERYYNPLLFLNFK